MILIFVETHFTTLQNMANLNQSVYSISKTEWGDDIPTQEDSSWVIYNSYRLYKIPFRDYNPEDIRFSLGQDICPEILVPLALEILEREGAFFEAENYEGDLILSVMRLEDDFWKLHGLQKQRIKNLILKNQHLYEDRHAFAEVVGLKEVRQEIKELMERFI